MFCNEIEIIEGELLEGDTIRTFVTEGYLTNVGSAENIVTSVRIYNKDNEEVDLLTVYYYHGEVPTLPADPVRPGYTFIEWDNKK